ncbi:hypothetical protein D3C72_2079710 [compost metagenome]
MEDAELEHGRRRGGQTVAAGVDPVGANCPMFVGDTQRFKQARAQVLMHGLAGDLGNDGRQHVTGRTGVDVLSARLVNQWNLEKLGDPAAVDAAPDRS